MSRRVIFYKTETGACPIEVFLDSLPSKAAQKIAWVLSIVEEFEIIPSKYFKKLKSSEDLFECKTDFGGNTYRLLGFFHSGNLIVLTNGFMKKTQKTPIDEMRLSISRKKDFLRRGGNV